LSDFQNESDILNNTTSRKNALGSEAEASLEDKSSDTLLTSLRDDKVGSIITQNWAKESSFLSEFLKRQAGQLDLLDNFSNAVGEANPFGGSSSLHVPMPFTVCKTYHARFMSGLLDIDPPFSVKARREDGTDAVQSIEDLMRFTLFSWANSGQGIDETIDTWIWNWCTTGTGIIKNRWLVEYEKYVDVEKKYIPAPPKLAVDAQGNNYEVPQWTWEEQEVTKTIRTQYCPQYDIVNNEDILIINGEGDPDKADMVLHRVYMSASELWTGVDRGIYDREVIEEMIRSGGNNPLSPGDNGSEIKQLRKIKAGTTSFGTSGRDVYEVIEACMKWDVDGSGIVTEIVVLVDKNTSQILRATYLRRVSRNGKRPYAVAHFHRRPGEPFGIGLLEILSPLSRELDLMHNTRIDNVLLQSTPFYIYRRTAGIDPEDVVLEPGAGIPVSDMGDIQFPSLPNRTQFTSNEESVVYSYVERLTGISDLALGVLTSTQGATRTATGARALMGENNTNLSIHLRRLNRGFTRLLQNTWFMLKNKVEPGFSFRVLGDDGRDIFREVTDIVMGVDVDFDVSANSTNSNKAVQSEVGQFLMSLTQNQLFLQAGLSDANKMYAAARHYLSSIGVKDVHRFVNRPVGYDYMPSPQEEFQRIVMGIAVQVQPGMDHEKAIAFLSSILKSQNEQSNPEAMLNEKQKLAVQDQLKSHIQMAQALQQQAAQQSAMNQMHTNMQMGVGGSMAGQGAPMPGQKNTYGQVFE
jgi:hypothetical protein